MKYIYAFLISFLLYSTANAQSIKLDLSNYDYDYAEFTVFTPYSNVGIRYVGAKEIPSLSPNLKFGGPINKIYLYQDVQNLEVHFGFSNPLLIRDINTDDFLINIRFNKSGKEEIVWFYKKDGEYIKRENE